MAPKRPSDLPDTPAPFSGTRPVAGEEAIVRRTADGWRVGDDELPDLTCAMVLADLIAAELPTDIQPAVPAAPPAAAPAARAGSSSRSAPRPGRGEQQQGQRPAEPVSAGYSVAEEANRLRTTVGQLEHALTARIRIEQAIGVLAERHRIRPRQAFEQLRSAARNRGRRVIDIASDVVASATNPLLQLPEELSRQRTGPRHAKNGRRALRLE
jgi:ANTAR domain